MGPGFTCLLLGGWGGCFPWGRMGRCFLGGGVGGTCLFLFGMGFACLFLFWDSVVHVNISNLNEYQLAIGI